MKDKLYQYRYGKPGLVSGLFAAYSLIMFGLFMFVALTNGSSVCSGLSFIFPLFIWLVSVPLLLIVSIIVIWRYGKRMKYLKGHQQVAPRSYIAVFFLVPIALLSVFWAGLIAAQVDNLAADSKMSTVDEFRVLVRDCKVGMVGFYHNNYHHRANDADAYIIVNAIDDGEKFYSYNQKDDLRQIMGSDYLVRCPVQTNYPEGSFGALDQYSEADWTRGIETFSQGC